jgi:hypothetical protein
VIDVGYCRVVGVTVEWYGVLTTYTVR